MPGNKNAHQGLSTPTGAQPASFTIHIPTRRVICIIVAVSVLLELLFVFLDYTINYSFWTELGPIRRLFNITREDGIASWFGVTQTLFAALTLWFIYMVESLQPSKRWVRMGWLVIALFFTYMAVDDGAEVHERVGSAFKAIQEQAAPGAANATLASRLYNKFPSYTWQLVLGPVFASLGLFTFVFLFSQLKTVKRRAALIAAIGLMGLAVCFDFVEGLEPEHRWNAYTHISKAYEMDHYTVTHFRELAYETLRHFSKSIEEFMEMLSMTILWATFLAYLGSRAPHFDVKFES